MNIKEIETKEYYELKTKLDDIQRMVESLYNLFLNNEKSEKPLTSAKIYELDQKARKKASEIKIKLNLE